jgi:hypothetical protein
MGAVMENLGIVTTDGDFTMLKYLIGLDAAQLERTVGFDKGRLDSGFLIVALAADEKLAPADFSLKASSRWSAGLVRAHASSEPGIDINDILATRGQDIGLLKERVARFLNQGGGNRPAKVLPNLRHSEGMKYPDAEARAPGVWGGVPQFHLDAPRRFLIVRREPGPAQPHAAR